MAGRPNRLNDDRERRLKPYERPRSMLQTVTSVVRHLLTPSWLSEPPSEPFNDQRPELINGEKESSVCTSLGSSPRSTRDCAVGPDGDLNEVPSPPMPATSRPETPLQRPLERPQERLQEQPLERTLGRLFEQPSERYDRPPERLSERPPERPLGQTFKRALERSPEQPTEWPLQPSQLRPGASSSPSSRTSLVGTPSSVKRQKLWYEDSPMKSPFYSGQTTYGGAAAQNRLRMLATSQTPTVPVMARGVKPGGATVGLSNTTRQILATLEKMATPVTEAKRVPLRSRIADGRSWTLPHRRDPPAPTQGGPPVRSAARPSIRTVVPPRTEMSRLEVSRKESTAAESSWADSLKAKVSRPETGKPEVPSVEAAKQYPLRKTEEPSVETSSVTVAPVAKPNSVTSAWEPPSNRSAPDRAPGGGKMVRVIHTAHPAPLKMSGSPSEPEEELPPAVPLPPIQRLPTFSFNLKPPQSLPATPSTTLASNSNGKTSGGSISSGLVSSSPVTSSSVSSSALNSNAFSSIPVSSSVVNSSAFSPSTINSGLVGTGPIGTNIVSSGPVSSNPVSSSTVSSSLVTSSLVRSGPISSIPTSSIPTSTNPVGALSVTEFTFSKPKPLASSSAALVAQPQRDQLYEFSEPWGPHGDEEQQEEKLPDEAGHGLKKPREAMQVDPPNKSVPEVDAETKEPENATAKNDKDSKNSVKDGGDLWERFKPAAGSWSCSVCMITNAASANCCQACETPRPGAAPKAAAAPTSVPSSAPAPVAPLPISVATAASRWECSTCLVRNETSATRCCACETLRPSAGSATAGATPSVVASGSLWECDTCLVRNQPTAVRCCACENPRPSASTATLSSAQAAAATFNFKLPSSEPSGFGGAPFAAAPMQFKFGIPSSGSAKPSEGAPSSESAAKPLKFGIPSTTTVTSAATKPTTSTTAAAPLKDFKFGSSSEEPSKAISFGSSASEASKAFKFGTSSEESATSFKFGTTTNEPTTKPLNFGATASEQHTKSFTFGASSEEPTKRAKPSTTTEEAAKLFNFGSSSDQPSKPLKFGCTAPEPAKDPQTGSGTEVSTKAFKFGATTDEPTKSSPIASSAEGASGGFKLGHMAEPSKGFPFASTTVKEPVKPFKFGTTPSTETATGGFKFGSTAEEPAKSVKPGSSEEQQPAAKTFKFLAPSGPAEPPKLFQFGMTAEQTPKLGAPVDTPAKPFSFGTPATTAGAAEAAPKQFSFGLAAKPSEMSAPTVTAQQPSIVPQGGSQTTTSGQLPGFLAPATTAPAAATPTIEPAKPAFPTSQFVFGQKTDASAATFSFGSQPTPAFPQPASGASAPLPSFGTLTGKPPEPHVAAQQPTFGIGATPTPAFGALNPLKPAATPAVAPTATSMPSGFGCQQPTPSTGFGLPAATVPTQPSFIFRPPTAAPPVTFQFGSTGPTSGGVFRFGAQPSQPATPLQQQPQQQQPALEPFGAPFGQTPPMQFGMSPSPLFPGPDSENPFNATSGSSGTTQQRRIRKAIRRKPTPR
ncbi:nuclear pore complex protein Nup153 isoform X2 [Rhipicephalus sanguineus]|uniref:nuclear pore complex protein Nup153 isoform X2 n=1 Tax=Rhipicephalus sanguineus TaxID=34632 RepID=UPI0020C4F667|nr:nuclear pore complex protein Nup153 isoform X2 [Rhipicephalus sanguineus]